MANRDPSRQIWVWTLDYTAAKLVPQKRPVHPYGLQGYAPCNSPAISMPFYRPFTNQGFR